MFMKKLDFNQENHISKTQILDQINFPFLDLYQVWRGDFLT
jgi:hypothetical protein